MILAIFAVTAAVFLAKGVILCPDLTLLDVQRSTFLIWLLDLVPVFLFSVSIEPTERLQSTLIVFLTRNNALLDIIHSLLPLLFHFFSDLLHPFFLDLKNILPILRISTILPDIHTVVLPPLLSPRRVILPGALWCAFVAVELALIHATQLLE